MEGQVLDSVEVRTLEDIESIESIPLEERDLPLSTYELIKRTAESKPQITAIRYIENGDKWKSAKAEGAETLATEITYSEFLGKIHQTANLLYSLGISSTDSVSMVLPNTPETHYVLWGGEACGIVNPINYMLEANEIGEIIHSAGSKVMVIHGPHEELDIWQKLPEILQAATSVEQVLVVGGCPEDLESLHGVACIDFDEALKHQNSTDLDFDRNFQPSDIASLFHTGGTTGLPKLAQHTHGNEVYTAWALNSLRQDEEDTCNLTGLPLFHCNAAIGTGLSVFMSGGTVLLAGINGYRTPGIVLNLYELIEHYRITHFSAVPTVIGIITQLPLNDFDLNSVKFAICGAAPMPVELFNKFQSVTGIRLLEGYGLTEATVCSSLTPPACDEPRIGSIGLRIPYTKMKTVILGDDGNVSRDCDVDEVGMLLIAGPSVTPGYTDSARNNGLFVIDENGTKWLVTGDLARQDGDGYFWLTGREKELIIRGGHNIDPKIIEEALAKHPCVNLVAAIGRPDKYAGEIPVVYVDITSPVEEEELLEFCRDNIGERAAIPKAVNILEQLPVTGVGKIHKPTLNLMEIEKTILRELSEIEPVTGNFNVKVSTDKKYGTLAVIDVKAPSGVNFVDLEENIQENLSGYHFKYELVTS